MSFLGTPGRIEALPSMSQEQMGLLGQLVGGLGGATQSGLSGLMQLLTGGGEAEQAYTAPAMRQFQEEIVPGLAERFSGMGAGAQQSSAFQQALGQAGAGLSERLAQQRAGLQQGARSQLAQLLGLGLGTSPFQYQTIPGTEGGLGKLLGGIGTGVGTGLGGGLLGLLGFGG